MIRLDLEQRSTAWRAARCGLLTGSRAADMLATLKNGSEAAARRDLRLQLAVERLTGLPADDAYVTRDMQRGIDLEAEALAAYEARTGVLIERVGFLQHPTLRAGCSPDGVVENGVGVVEVKVPKSTTHLSYLRGGIVPTEHRAQVVHNLWISGAEWCDFVSYDPRFPPALSLFIVRTDATGLDFIAYARTVEAFMADVERDAAAVAALIEASR